MIIQVRYSQCSSALQKEIRRTIWRARIHRWLGRLVPALQLRYSPGQAVAKGEAEWNSVGINIDNWIWEARSGAQPTTADLAPTGTIGSSITLPADAMATTASPGATTAKAGTWQDASADANVTVGWVRLRAPGDAGTTNNTDRRIDGAATITGGGGEWEFQNLVFAIGQQITVTTATFTQPKQ